jgi:hypothetical protein
MKKLRITNMDTELEQKIYHTLIDNLPNDDNFINVVNNLLTLIEKSCSEKAAYHNQTLANEQFNYWNSFQQEIHHLKILKQQEKIKSYRGKLKWEDNLEEMRTNG